ncbi:hypothetical protein K439DRAFT_1338306 [Ramaria rubella]|nr:hypothetical protein K439DRAFT_1338306 [Ramaria rubella]
MENTIMAKLHDKKVWGLVDGSEVNSGPSISINTSYYQGDDSWEICDRKAHSTIVKHMSNSLIFKHVTHPQISKELWESVDRSSDISEHISKIRTAEKKLSSMKQIVDKEFMAFSLLHSLPSNPKFKTLITTILNSVQSDKTLSFSKVESRLMAQDIYNKREDVNSTTIVSGTSESANKTMKVNT